jgi:hypothetical protein
MIRRCSALLYGTGRGVRCTVRPGIGSPFCHYHEPEAEARRDAKIKFRKSFHAGPVVVI